MKILILSTASVMFCLFSYAKGIDVNCTTTECHNQMRRFPVLHGPIKAEGCNVCHRPVGSPEAASERTPIDTNPKLPQNHPRMLAIPEDKVNSTCLVCHDDKTGEGHKYVHAAITKKTCVSCHSPHGGEHKNLLKINPVVDLCLSCHKEQKDNLHMGHAVALTEKNACLNCHQQHFSNEKKLLRAPVGQLCLQCHNKAVTKKDGTVLDNIGGLLKAGMSKHKPVEEGTCDKCHDPHGTPDHAFLKLSYASPDFQLCMSCHKPELMGSVETDSATKFRNGTVNLHYKHLHNRSQVHGCYVCHEVHASSQAKLIRTQMNFDEWKVPINYKKTETGGSCAAACHHEKKYDRVKPFENQPGR